MTRIDKAREAYNRADRRAEVLKNRWEMMLILESKRQQLREMRKERKQTHHE